jgi:tetratricopeptide (TPR) repeat protein
MGVVYRARREDGDTDVALKVIAAGEDASPEALARFQREARIAQELDHPGMREFTWEQAVTIVRDVADALAVAHDKGVLHRDIKPSNILMDGDGKPHLTDFGLAKDTRTESKYTRTGQTLGTPAYMSPEQARGDLAQLTPASDVWALGCVLFEALSGRPAFEGDTVAAVVGHVLTGQPPVLRLTGTVLPAGVSQVVAACLAKDPFRRPPTGASLRSDLERVLRGERPNHRAGPPASRMWLAAAIVACGVVAGIGLTVIPSSAPPEVSHTSALVEDGKAAGLARRGWGLRRTDPRAGAELLRQSLEREPEHHDRRLQLGVLLWAIREHAAAREAWSAVPKTASQWASAQLNLALEAQFRLLDGGGAEVSESHARAIANVPGAAGATAQALLAANEGDLETAQSLLAGVTGWKAALLRAMTVEHSEPARMLEALDEALEDGLLFAWALNHRANAKKALGRVREAMADYDAALQIDPNYVLALNNRGHTKQSLGDLKGALADFEAGVAAGPRYSDVRLNRALARAAIGDDAGARTDYDAAIRLAANPANALSCRGVFKFDRGDLRGALADYGEAIEHDPSHQGARVNRALARDRSGDVAGALEDLEHLLQRDAADLAALMTRSDILHRRGDPRAAIRDLDRVLAVNKSHRRALSNRGAIKGQMGDAAGALRDFDAALHIDPRSTRTLVNRALMKETMRDFAGACADATECLAIDPKFVLALVCRGRSHQALGERQLAMEDFDEAIRIDPEAAIAYADRAALKRSMGDTVGAMADYDTCLRIQPRNAAALHNRGSIRRVEGDLPGALEDLQAAIAVNPRSPLTRYECGNVKAQLGDPAGALAEYDAGLALAPRDYRILAHRGSVLAQLGRFADASRSYARALELAPPNWPRRPRVQMQFEHARASAGREKR